MQFGCVTKLVEISGVSARKCYWLGDHSGAFLGQPTSVVQGASRGEDFGSVELRREEKSLPCCQGPDCKKSSRIIHRS